MFTDRLDCHLLIVAVGDAVLHAEVVDVVPFTFLDHQFQVALGMESVQPTWRIAQSVYDIGLKAIGVVDDRSSPVTSLQAVGIQFGLVLALDGGCACPLGFDNGKGKSVAPEEHIIAESFSAAIDKFLLFGGDSAVGVGDMGHTALNGRPSFYFNLYAGL